MDFSLNVLKASCWLVVYFTSKMSLQSALIFHLATFGLDFCLAVNLRGSFANLYLFFIFFI